MAPGTKVTKIKKAGGKDIRMFFTGAPAGGTQKANVAGLKKKDAIEISDDESRKTTPRAAASIPTPPATLASKAAPTPVKKRAVASDDDEEEAGEQPVSAPPAKRKKVARVVESEEESEDERPPPKKRVVKSPAKAPKEADVRPAKKPRASAAAAAKGRKKKDEDDFVVDDDEDVEIDVDEEEGSEVDEEELFGNKKAVQRAPVRKGKAKEEKEGKKPAKRAEKEDEEDDKPKAKKFNWAAAKAAKLAGPVAHGSKAVPDGAPDALAGLSFVFTGELSSFSRDEAVDLAKRFGGRVVGQPSSKTDYVVLGEDAGPKKLEAIKKHKLHTLSEDEFLQLIGSRKGLNNGVMDEKTKKKIEKEMKAIKDAAKEMEKREKQEVKQDGGTGKVDPSSQLWTTRYAPQSLKDICGNKAQVDRLQSWLHDWQNNYTSGFKKPGKNMTGVYRAILITGPPGIGKTTSAHLCAKLEGYTPIELNASDTRSKKLVESGMNINNKSLDEYVSGSHDTNAVGVKITNRSCIIMDEVDGMSAGDRGGVGALNALIKKTKIPIICIANDKGAQKLNPLKSTTYSLTFHKPQAAQIRSRILTIAFKEKMKIPANVIDQLVAGAQSDIRQVLNMLSTWKLGSDSMDFDEAKHMAKMNEKYTIMTPFDITSKVLGPYLFSSTSRETLGDKMDYYFQDHSFMPLFIQENYLKVDPAKLKGLDGPEKALKHLELMDKAASSISDGDLVDAMIHGPEQHWSLMPLHAVTSTVRPAAQLYGSGLHYGASPVTFPQWLGQNSRQNKLGRQLTDVQIRMRLKVSGDKSEIRQSYIPALFPHIVRPLMDTGVSAVEEVIERMDEYYLSKEDWDTIVELGVDEHRDDFVTKKISAATKGALTRKYNASEHPIPFHKAVDLGKAPRKLAAGPLPDVEEAFDLDEAVEEASDDESKKKKKDDGGFGGDKLIKESKKKKAPAAKGKSKKS